MLPKRLKDRLYWTGALAFLLALLGGTGVSRAAGPEGLGTYYVNNMSATSSATGPGTQAKPYNTISGALAAHPDSGVVIVVVAGTYREKIVVGVDGRPGTPVVLRTNGGPVVIDGADDFSGAAQWAPFAGDVWLASGVTWTPQNVYADGARLQPSSQAPDAVGPGEWLYVPGSGLYVNAGGGSPASHAAAVGRRTHGFLVSGHSNIFIDGFTIQRAEYKGVEVINASHVIVKRNEVRQCGSGGIEVESSTDVQIFGNRVSDSNHHGIEFREGTTNSIIDQNESFANAHAVVSWATGIYLAGSPNNLIENNLLHDNQDSGIEIQTGSNDNVVRQNVSWSNGDHGFAQLYATGTLLLNDVAWGNHTEGFSVEGGSTGTRLYNCISVNRGLAPQSYCMFVDSSSTAGFDADYNIYWSLLGLPPVRFGLASYPTVAAFQNATGIGMHSFAADPRFVDTAHGDFHLRWDSPAIDAATTSIPDWDALDADGFMRTDAPDTPNTGAGAVGFADRGAYEYQGSVLAVGGEPGPRALALSGAFPNPSRRVVAFTLRLPASADVSWSVYDVAGREVWSERGVRPAGDSTVRWPLTDRSGAPVPNGLYLVRVHRGDETATARFAVVR